MKYMVLACLFLLGGCVTAGLQATSTLLPLITTDLSAACASGQVLVAQASASGLKSAAGSTAKAIASPCAKINTIAGNSQVLVDSVNTTVAGLLGIAGAAGVSLKGL